MDIDIDICIYIYMYVYMCRFLARVEYTLARAVDAVALKSRCAAVSDTYANQVLHIRIYLYIYVMYICTCI